MTFPSNTRTFYPWSATTSNCRDRGAICRTARAPLTTEAAATVRCSRSLFPFVAFSDFRARPRLRPFSRRSCSAFGSARPWTSGRTDLCVRHESSNPVGWTATLCLGPRHHVQHIMPWSALKRSIEWWPASDSEVIDLLISLERAVSYYGSLHITLNLRLRAGYAKQTPLLCLAINAVYLKVPQASS